MVTIAGGLLPNAEQQFCDSNGVPLAGGFLFTYIPGTTTPKLTWQDPGLTVPNGNPLVLDSGGRAIIWGSGAYRQVLTDLNGNLIWDQVTTFGAGGATGSVNSIAALRAFPVPDNGTPIWLLGYVNEGDKPPALYYYSQSAVASDNGGTVIQPVGIPAGSPGRWIMPIPNYQGFVNLVDFGPVGQGGDDTAAMNAAIATGYSVQLPALPLNFNTPGALGRTITITAKDQWIRGANVINNPNQATLAGTLISSTLSGDIIFFFNNAGACGITDCAFSCPSMSDGWCIFFQGTGPCAFAANLNFFNCPGVIAQGLAARNTWTTNIRAAQIAGGSVSIVDGSTSTLRAALYGFGTNTQTGNSGPWLVSDVVLGGLDLQTPIGPAAIALYINGACNSSIFKTVRINFFDTGVVLDDTLDEPTGNLPDFTHMIDVQVQTPHCTLLDGAGWDLRSGTATQIMGQVFCNNVGPNGYGMYIGASVIDIKIYGIRFNGASNDCVFIQGNGVLIDGGNITSPGRTGAAWPAGGVAGAACVHVGGNASNVVIANVMGWGNLPSGCFDLKINSGAVNVFLIGNSWTGGPLQPSAIADPNFIGQYFPAIRQAWTPTLAFATPGNSSWTYTTQVGWLWQDGPWIAFKAIVIANVNSYTTASGQLFITGLPVTAAADGVGNVPCTVSKWGGITPGTNFTQVGVESTASASTLGVFQSGSAATSPAAVNTANVPAGTNGVTLHVFGRLQLS